MNAPTITRRQAWARLIVAMVDEELPEPADISFHPNGDLLNVQVSSIEAVAGWADHFGARVKEPFESHESGRWIHGAVTFDWNGFSVEVTAYVPGPAAPQPVDEDLTAVRALADQDIALAVGEVAGAGAAPATAPAQTAAGGAAETVWVAQQRRGIDFHAIGDGMRSACGRSIHAGYDVSRSEVAQLSATPCARCYPDGA